MGKKNLLGLVIRRELLIQEAQRQGLDKNDAFMRTIERYWKQTLVKEVLKAKTKSLKGSMSEAKARRTIDDWIKEIYDSADVTIDKKLLGKIKR